MQLHERINRWIGSKGWTMAETARRLGKSKTTLHRWCHGYGNPRHQNLEALCAELGVSLETFWAVLPERGEK